MADTPSRPWLALVGGVAAAIAASLCCIGPLVLVLLGLGGAWVSQLALLEPYRPVFLGAAVIALVLAWKKLYRPAACTPGSICASPRTARIYRLIFWLVVALVALAFVFPWLAPLFY